MGVDNSREVLGMFSPNENLSADYPEPQWQWSQYRNAVASG
jgi:hypothetical protein